MQTPNIYVTKPYLPPLEEYVTYLEQIWHNQYLTNSGPLALELEKRLQEYLGVKHVLFVSNGTAALQLAIKALGITKEIITTPFTFAATAHAIMWEHCTPRFVDIDPLTFCIDPDTIAEAINENTQAILPVHIYGIPCDTERIQEIAKQYKLKMIYDAAHAFGVRVNNQSVMSFGDVSVISFHATKLFSTGEGGAIATNNDHIAEKIRLLRNFGISQDVIQDLGINAKNSELHAAYGLVSLQHIDEIMMKRKLLTKAYDELLLHTPLKKPFIEPTIEYNYPYYPVLFPSEVILQKTLNALKAENIYAKRYFHPSLNTVAHMKGDACPIAEFTASRIVCLPLYPDLTVDDVERIAAIVIQSLYYNYANFKHSV